jgi:hypothetical protein
MREKKARGKTRGRYEERRKERKRERPREGERERRREGEGEFWHQGLLLRSHKLHASMIPEPHTGHTTSHSLHGFWYVYTPPSIHHLYGWPTQYIYTGYVYGGFALAYTVFTGFWLTLIICHGPCGSRKSPNHHEANSKPGWTQLEAMNAHKPFG